MNHIENDPNKFVLCASVDTIKTGKFLQDTFVYREKRYFLSAWVRTKMDVSNPATIILTPGFKVRVPATNGMCCHPPQIPASQGKAAPTQLL